MVKYALKERFCLYPVILLQRLCQRKPSEWVEEETHVANGLQRNVLSLVQLVSIGLGSTIGAGIFVRSGTAAALYAGPSVIISFILSGIVALLSALSFAELSSAMCTSGSAYTFAYVALGELIGFLVGWSYILINLLTTATVVAEWSRYVVDLISLISSHNVTRLFVEPPVRYYEETGTFGVTGQVIDLPAIAITIAVTVLLFVGTRESAIFNQVFVVFKVIVLLIFLFAGCVYVKREHYTPFFPPNKGSFEKYGFTGMLKASSSVFFAYLGFEGVPAMAKEAKNSSQNVSRSIIIVLVITICLYVGISTVMVGLVSYRYLDQGNPLSEAIKATPYGMWLLVVLNLGAMASLTSVAISTLLIHTRIFYAMAYDGLLPAAFSKIHQTRKTPWFASVICGIVCVVLAGVCPVDAIGEAASLAALIVYILVHVCAIVIRYNHASVSKYYPVKFFQWAVPTVGILLCILLLINTNRDTAIRYLVWMGVGVIFYFSYSFWFSELTRKNGQLSATSEAPLEPRTSISTINVPEYPLPSKPDEPIVEYWF